MSYINTYAPVQHLRKSTITVPGICYLTFAKTEDVQLWPRPHPVTGVLKSFPLLKTGKTWYQLQPIEKDRIIKEEDKTSVSGPWQDITVTGIMAGDNINNLLSTIVLPYHQYVIIAKDRNGFYKMVGNKTRGASANASYINGDADGTLRRLINFTWQHPNPAPVIYQNEIIIANEIYTPPFAVGGDFGGDFSDDFGNDYFN